MPAAPEASPAPGTPLMRTTRWWEWKRGRLKGERGRRTRSAQNPLGLANENCFASSKASQLARGEGRPTRPTHAATSREAAIYCLGLADDFAAAASAVALVLPETIMGFGFQ